MRKALKIINLPDLGGLSREQKTVILASLFVRSRSLLLFQAYILLGEEFFTFLTEFSGKEVRVPSRAVLKKYLAYARIYSFCKGRDLTDEKVLLDVARRAGIRKHQVVPIYKRVEKTLLILTDFIRSEFRLESEPLLPKAADDKSKDIEESIPSPPEEKEVLPTIISSI